jgi:hypothetical protein
MKRMFVIPFVSALIGGGIVVAVVAAFGGLGESKKTIVNNIESAPPTSATRPGWHS